MKLFYVLLAVCLMAQLAAAGDVLLGEDIVYDESGTSTTTTTIYVPGGGQTESYTALITGNQIGAVTMPYLAALGDLFWAALIFTPYLGMTLNHRSVNIASIWLFCAVVGYGGLIDGFTFSSVLTYLLIVVWMVDVLRRLLSPIYSN
jgi:hypothetical protein